MGRRNNRGTVINSSIIEDLKYLRSYRVGTRKSDCCVIFVTISLSFRFASKTAKQPSEMRPTARKIDIIFLRCYNFVWYCTMNDIMSWSWLDFSYSYSHTLTLDVQAILRADTLTICHQARTGLAIPQNGGAQRIPRRKDDTFPTTDW